MLDRKELSEFLDDIMQREVEQFLATVPYASHLTDPDQELDTDYYLRHRVETIKRIRMTSKTDALALACMVEEDYDAARWWSQYVAEELGHDVLFMNDLRQYGYTNDAVEEVEPFQSTKTLLEYLTKNIESTGSLAAVAYSLFVEWNSERYSPRVVEKAEKKYSASYVSGSKAHLAIDKNEGHYETMLDITHSLLIKYGDENVLIDLIKHISGFFRDYFCELYEESVERRELEGRSLDGH